MARRKNNEVEDALEFMEMPAWQRDQVVQQSFETFLQTFNKKQKFRSRQPEKTILRLSRPSAKRVTRRSEKSYRDLNSQIKCINQDITEFEALLDAMPDEASSFEQHQQMMVLVADICHRREELKRCEEKKKIETEILGSIIHDTDMSDGTTESSSEF